MQWTWWSRLSFFMVFTVLCWLLLFLLLLVFCLNVAGEWRQEANSACEIVQNSCVWKASSTSTTGRELAECAILEDNSDSPRTNGFCCQLLLIWLSLLSSMSHLSTEGGNLFHVMSFDVAAKEEQVFPERRLWRRHIQESFIYTAMAISTYN